MTGTSISATLATKWAPPQMTRAIRTETTTPTIVRSQPNALCRDRVMVLACREL